MLEFYNHNELFHLTMEILSYPSAVGMTGRLLKETCWKIWGLGEMSGPSSFIMEFLRTAVALLWVSRRNLTTLRPQASNQQACGSVPAGGGGTGKWCHHPCQPRGAGSFEHATLILSTQVQSPWVFGWAVSGKFTFLSSLSKAYSLPLSLKVFLQCWELVS